MLIHLLMGSLVWAVGAGETGEGETGDGETGRQEIENRRQKTEDRRSSTFVYISLQFEI